MIPEREIEERLKAKFAAALAATRNAASIRTVGFWDVADDGEVKGEGDDSDVVFESADRILGRSFGFFDFDVAVLGHVIPLNVGGRVAGSCN